MIFLYTGKTGSGKTYNMIKDVYPRWRRGEDIYSNTALFFEQFGGPAGCNIVENPEYFTIWEKCVEKIRFIWLVRIKKKDFRPSCRGKIVYFDDFTELIEIRNAVIVFDEAQNVLDAYNWENTPPELRNKLRAHRHDNLDLYATTQNMGTIDINMRRLVQHWVHHKDVFALFTLRNPSWLTIHSRETKDIDFLTNKVDDLLVPTVRRNFFLIHKFSKRYYDTLYDIGFKCYKVIWIQENKKKICLIIPNNWTLSNARQQLLLHQFFLNPTKLNLSKTS